MRLAPTGFFPYCVPMTEIEKCQPHGFTNCCNLPEPTIEASECLNFGPDCAGAVEYRYPLSGTGRSYPRCDAHWSERLDLDMGLRERYPEHPPSDYDFYDAGEYWSEDDY